MLKQSSITYVSNRILKINVGFLLNAGPGTNHETAFDAPAVRVADDLMLDYIRGPIRMSRTKEGILLQGQLQVGVTDECYRCLDVVTDNVTIKIEELYAYPSPLAAEFSLNDDGILDLAPLLRAEALIISSRGLLCRPDCKGLCPDCGTNLNHSECTCALNNIDPRMAQFRQLLNSSQ